jgi:hypothetical protein
LYFENDISKLKLAEMLVEHVLAETNSRREAILASPLPAVEKLFRILRIITGQQKRFVTKTLLEGLRSQLYLWQRIEAFRRE